MGEFMYQCEYSKSNQEAKNSLESCCRVCEANLKNDDTAPLILRRALSLTKTNDWVDLGPFLYHMHCFVEEFQPTNVDFIKNFESLDIADQISIQEMVGDKLQGKAIGVYKRVSVDDDDQTDNKRIKTSATSQLPPKIQELVKTLFETLAEIELINRERKQSAENIELALKVLDRISQELSYRFTSNCEKLSKDFYRFVPCNLESTIDTEEKILQMRKLVESMRTIEAAYLNVRHEIKTELDPVDRLYERLGCDIAVVESEDPMYSIIKQYLENTTGLVDRRKLTIDELYKVDRHGEATRNKPFKDLHNRQLLWHGSQLTNFVGILQNGLKVAPHEAKHTFTGERFGKGIYFSSFAAKSAFYSLKKLDKNDPVSGFMVLCEVALGNVQFIDFDSPSYELDYDKHSIRAGMISTAKPYVLSNGVQVPLGPLETTGLGLCDEYVVRDPAQVSVKYLVRVKDLRLIN